MPSLKRPKSTLAKMALSSNQYVLKVQRMAKLWEFSPGHPNPYFLKKCKEGTKGNFSEIAQKVALA